MTIYFLVGLGGALGSVMRYACSGLVALLMGAGFPYGTLFVNVTGAAAIGFLAAITAPDGRLLVRTELRQFLMVGICGGYTTFSTFSRETLNLMRGREWMKAGLNMTLSLVCCLIAAWLGYAGASTLNQLRG